MNADKISELLFSGFPHEPTTDQRNVTSRLAVFLSKQRHSGIFILKGYAGTGKTSLMQAIVKVLPKLKLKEVLLAPTGRAAKVLSSYTVKPAWTIHRKIYFSETDGSGAVKFHLQKNSSHDTLYIVDEASMISGGNSLFGTGSLLDDLIKYVYEGKNCRLLLVGDTAQLPPVGETLSPALNDELLQKRYDTGVESYELREVVRQQSGSGILLNATRLRNAIADCESGVPTLSTHLFPDVHRITGNELTDYIENAYSQSGVEETIIVCRSNKRANNYNQQLRARILLREDELTQGDLMMVVKNNYFWLGKESKAAFIANGDIINITKVKSIEDKYGFRFAGVTARMVDYPDEPELELKLILDTVFSETASMKPEENKKLYDAIVQEYQHIPNGYKRMQQIRTDPYLNALQVKFAYAVTCHKSQGGQWKTVFADQGYITDDMLTTEYLRWLYTAVTRATEKLYLVNFHERFFEKEIFSATGC